MSVASFARAAIIGALLCLLALLSGCQAVRLGYGQAPTLTYWWLDGHVGFTDAQTPRVKNAVADWFAWHRTTQLPDYAALLTQVQAEVLAPVTPQQICGWRDVLVQRLDTLAEQSLPALADVAVSLSPDQLAHLEAKYAQQNQKFVDNFIERTPPRRQAASLQRTVRHAERLYGSLGAEQRGVLARGLAASPFDAKAALAERQAWQNEVLRVLRQLRAERQTPEQALPRLRALVAALRHSPRPEYRAYQERLTQHHCALVAELHNSTTPAQRRTAADRFKSWEADFRALAAAGAAAP